MKTIEEQTGWRRPHSDALCQEPEVLLRISEYSFDLTDSDFRDYFASRTGQVIEASQFDFYQNWTQEQVMNRRNFATKKGSVNSVNSDRKQWWEIVRLTRGKLQDCWELYQRTVKG